MVVCVANGNILLNVGDEETGQVGSQRPHFYWPLIWSEAKTIMCRKLVQEMKAELSETNSICQRNTVN